jgi:hypothetical protein
MLTTTIMDFLIAIGLGLLVGLQKERDASPLAGLKTFALATVLAVTASNPPPPHRPPLARNTKIFVCSRDGLDEEGRRWSEARRSRIASWTS